MLCDEAEPQGERKGKVTESIYLICSVYTVFSVVFLPPRRLAAPP